MLLWPFRQAIKLTKKHTKPNIKSRPKSDRSFIRSFVQQQIFVDANEESHHEQKKNNVLAMSYH